MPTWKGTEVSLSHIQCFLYLVSSINLSIFLYHIVEYFLDIPHILPFMRLSFILLVSFTVQKLFILMKSYLFTPFV